MTGCPIERNFIPHSTTLARGWMSGNRLGGVVGCGFGRFRFGANAGRAFGGCVGLDGSGGLDGGRAAVECAAAATRWTSRRPGPGPEAS